MLPEARLMREEAFKSRFRRASVRCKVSSLNVYGVFPGNVRGRQSGSFERDSTSTRGFVLKNLHIARGTLKVRYREINRGIRLDRPSSSSFRSIQTISPALCIHTTSRYGCNAPFSKHSNASGCQSFEETCFHTVHILLYRTRFTSYIF